MSVDRGPLPGFRFAGRHPVRSRGGTTRGSGGGPARLIGPSYAGGPDLLRFRITQDVVLSGKVRLRASFGLFGRARMFSNFRIRRSGCLLCPPKCV